mmetsp:Transcript_17334/g.19730  ORF Transcript_17334/g.19730 Transcript_17334/m.19730 type:complete len:81 (-) Transcript_17334:41-283(-)
MAQVKMSKSITQKRLLPQPWPCWKRKHGWSSKRTDEHCSMDGNPSLSLNKKLSSIRSCSFVVYLLFTTYTAGPSLQSHRT